MALGVRKANNELVTTMTVGGNGFAA